MNALVTPLSFKSLKDLKAHAHATSAVFCDLIFTQIRGGLRHISIPFSLLPDKENSVLVGSEKITLTPDLSFIIKDPFAAQGAYKVFCTKSDDMSRDSRSALAAFSAQQKTLCVVVEMSFVLTDPQENVFLLPSLPPFIETPHDRYADIRAEIVTVLRSMGIGAAWHYHPGGAPGACRIGFASEPLMVAADGLQLTRYTIENVAASYGKNAHMDGPSTLFLTLSEGADRIAHYAGSLTALLNPDARVYKVPLSSPPTACALCNPYLALLGLGRAATLPPPDSSWNGPLPHTLPDAISALLASALLPEALAHAYSAELMRSLAE